jgi:alpha-D-ribose 1-methylphosphonate 5-triphosphate synthase subunit PhnH
MNRGFADPVLHSQAVFRVLMAASAAPARAVGITVPGIEPPHPLSPLAAALVLTLCDFETALWLDPVLAEAPDISAFIRFHTGAKLVDQPETAEFALVSNAASMPQLMSFGQGTAEYPDRSTTLILQVASFAATGLQFEGPGFETRRTFSSEPMPGDFARQWNCNTALFPRGVDLVFAAPGELAALPRSSKLVRGAPCT